MYVDPGTGEELPEVCHFLPESDDPPLSTVCMYFQGFDFACSHCGFKPAPLVEPFIDPWTEAEQRGWSYD